MPAIKMSDFVGCRIRCGRSELEVMEVESPNGALICEDDDDKRWRLSPSQANKCQVLKLRGEPRI